MPTGFLRIFLLKNRRISMCSNLRSMAQSRIRSIFGFCSIYLPKHLMSFAGWEQQEARRLNESAAGKTARADARNLDPPRGGRQFFTLYKLKICIDRHQT